MNKLCLSALALLSACAATADETITGYGALGKSYVVTEIDGAPFAARATLSFPAVGRIEGRAPCNTFFGAVTVPYPWIDIGPLATSRMACPDLAEETKFLSALQSMQVAEVNGDLLLLSVPGTDRSMLFQAE